MKFESAGLAGVTLVTPPRFEDHRGAFVKTFHEGLWAEAGIRFHSAEEFFSTSHRGVLRGMHFQNPPHDHAKVVTCLSGAVLDVVLDLRKSSATYGHSIGVELSASNRRILHIPSGFAHGFLALEDDSLMHYRVSTVHAPSADAGVRWDSFGFDWGAASPQVSTRDAAFPGLSDFMTPFV